jgi:transcriptional regulator with XRE-family HTH domain
MRTDPGNAMAETIRRRFRASGKSIRQVALESGLGYAAVHGLLNGDRDLTLASATRLCEVLGLELRAKRRSTRRKGE